MIKKSSRFFNTSGPCNYKENYTLFRNNLINQGIDLVKRKRYFTIWAPRQTGKSTYFRLLKGELEKLDYKVVHINVENYKNISETDFLRHLNNSTKEDLDLDFKSRDFENFAEEIKLIKDKQYALIIDEIEGLNPKIFNQFLHTIRNLYHFRENHALKSVVFVGVSNILGVIQDNASPFNIADNLDVPYFTEEEVFELLEQHENETNQKFSAEVKAKIYEITAGQPGLVNGFAGKLVTNYPEILELDLAKYYEIEDWYLRLAIDKNVENIVNKARQYRNFVEKLLFTEEEIEFDLSYPHIRYLYTQGVIKENVNKKISFGVPLYKKKLYKAFCPFFNGESSYFFVKKDQTEYLDSNNKFDLNELITNFCDYVKERSLKHFMDRNPDGSYERLKEAAAGYAFSTYIEHFVASLRGKIYYESNTGLGKTDMLINAMDHEYLVEFKVFSDGFNFKKGKAQVAYYAKNRKLPEAHYVVFASTLYKQKKNIIKESVETTDNITIYTRIIWYDEERDF